MGSAMGQLGLSLGAGLAPRFAVFFAYNYSWRWAFYGAAIMSLAWIPVWLFTSSRIKPTVSTAQAGHEGSGQIDSRPKIVGDGCR